MDHFPFIHTFQKKLITKRVEPFWGEGETRKSGWISNRFLLRRRWCELEENFRFPRLFVCLFACLWVCRLERNFCVRKKILKWRSSTVQIKMEERLAAGVAAVTWSVRQKCFILWSVSNGLSLVVQIRKGNIGHSWQINSGSDCCYLLLFKEQLNREFYKEHTYMLKKFVYIFRGLIDFFTFFDSLKVHV